MRNGAALDTDALLRLVTRAFNNGYGQGHDDTVEGCFTCVEPVDTDTYHSDITSEIIDDFFHDHASETDD